jgi:hypothetical protein
MTRAEVYKAIVEGRMTQEQFEDWVQEQTSEAYDNGAADAHYYNSVNN